MIFLGSIEVFAARSYYQFQAQKPAAINKFKLQLAAITKKPNLQLAAITCSPKISQIFPYQRILAIVAIFHSHTLRASDYYLQLAFQNSLVF